MDFVEGLAKQASQITMYDVKSYYNQAKNMVLNIPEMEAKVREATNEDAWGASSTLMQEIAQGTHNFQHFNEIMPTIYSRFMEKEAREWRQIYKALTLLEYLIKHGSERVVDDARAHISTIKMLRNFHYTDEKGKDQGINVRNRANEIASLLSDVDKIRQERRKARSNRNKYQGHEGGMFNTASGSRYGGFGSDSMGGGGGGGGSRGGYGGDDEFRSSSRGSGSASASNFRDPNPARTEYDEYEGADDFEEAPRRPAASSRASRAPAAPPKATPASPPKAKQPEVNLFDFDDEPVSAPAAAPAAPAAPAAALDAFGDDDFDDFQSAAPAPAAPAAAPAPTATRPAGGANANLFALLESSTPSVPTSAPARAAPAPTLSPQAAVPNYGQPMAARPAQVPMSPPQPQQTGAAASPVKPKAATSTFDDLWTTSLGSAPAKPTGSGAGGKKTIAEMQKETANASLWGAAPKPTATSSAAAPKPAASANSGFDDLLL